MKPYDFCFPRQAYDEEEEIEEEDDVDRSSNEFGVVGVKLMVGDSLEIRCRDMGERGGRRRTREGEGRGKVSFEVRSFLPSFSRARTYAPGS